MAKMPILYVREKGSLNKQWGKTRHQNVEGILIFHCTKSKQFYTDQKSYLRVGSETLKLLRGKTGEGFSE